MVNWRKPTILLLAAITGSKIPKYLRNINALDKGKIANLEDYQKSRLTDILLHSWKNVPYYRKILEKHFVVSDGKVNFGDFHRLPILTKDIIRNNFDALTSRDYKKRKWYFNTSGGSTGEPVRLIQDREYSDWNIANKIYYKTFSGQDIGDKELRFWGSERDLMVGRESFDILAKNYLYNRSELNVFKMTEDNMRRYIDSWNAYRPRWVEGYAQSLYEFAVFVEKEGTPIHSPKGILSSAGTLYPEMKEKMKTIFNCPVFNRYGSREVGDIACSCEREQGLHLSLWNHYLEILDSNLEPVLPGEMGRVYVSTLNNYSMPLLRYDIGDFARKARPGEERCGCLRASAVIDSVEGRESSVLRTRDGKIIPGQYFIHFLGVVLNKGHIKRFQIVQKDFERILVRVTVNNEEAFEQSKQEIIDMVLKAMGPDCIVIFEKVDDIPPLANGKYIYTVCEIK